MVFLASGIVIAQETTTSITANTIKEIVVEKNHEKVVDLMVINMTGLKVGGTLSRDNSSEAIRRLWNSNILSDISIYSDRLDDGLKVTIKVEIMPAVKSITTDGFEEVEEKEILTLIKLTKGNFVDDRKIYGMKKKIMDLYHEKGFLLANVDFVVSEPDTSLEVDIAINMNEGQKIKIKSIAIEGNQNISDSKLKKVMTTKEDRWYRSGEYKEDVLEEDKNKIVALYKSQGFRDAIVLRDSTYYDEVSEKVQLTLVLQEGKKYKFGKSTIEGNTRFDMEEMFSTQKYEEGDTFNEELLEFSKYEMIVRYTNNGYLKTFIDAVQYAHGDTVDVHYDIAEGSISTIKKIIIEGNTKTKEKIIRREIRMLPGAAFNREELERSQRDILALNYFDPSKVGFDYEPAENPDEVNIKVNVEERSTGMASMGAGYSERDKLVGQFGFSNANIFGNGQRVNFNWDMGSRRKAFQVGFSEPWLFNTPTSFSFDVYNIISSDYTSAFDQERRRGGYIRVGRQLKWPDYSRAFLTYRLEDVDYSDPLEIYSYYLTTGKTSALSFMFIRDSRDLPQFATDGSRTSATFELAGGPLGGDLSYYKYLLNNEIYTPLFWKLSVVARFKLGFLKGYQENTWVSYSERFMPGGTSYDGFVRGYENRQVGPRLSGEEIGGETMFVNNLELQIPIVANMVYGVAFYDFGNSWQNLSTTNPFDVKRSVGAGVRLFVPQIGLIGFDFGYGMDKLEGDNNPSGWHTHFQFGQQF